LSFPRASGIIAIKKDKTSKLSQQTCREKGVELARNKNKNAFSLI
jgi:hypothetical protein